MDVAVFSEAATPKLANKQVAHSMVSSKVFFTVDWEIYVRRSVEIKHLEEDRKIIKKIVLLCLYEEVQGKGLAHQVVKSTAQRKQSTAVTTELYQLQHINYLHLQMMK